jgi:hypothetical protein
MIWLATLSLRRGRSRDLAACPHHHRSQREHFIAEKRVEAKSAVPKSQELRSNAAAAVAQNTNPTKLFVGGTVSAVARACPHSPPPSRVACMVRLVHGLHAPPPASTLATPPCAPAPPQGDITDVQLRDYFGNFGEIKDSVVLMTQVRPGSEKWQARGVVARGGRLQARGRRLTQPRQPAPPVTRLSPHSLTSPPAKSHRRTASRAALASSRSQTPTAS